MDSITNNWECGKVRSRKTPTNKKGEKKSEKTNL